MLIYIYIRTNDSHETASVRTTVSQLPGRGHFCSEEVISSQTRTARNCFVFISSNDVLVLFKQTLFVYHWKKDHGIICFNRCAYWHDSCSPCCIGCLVLNFEFRVSLVFLVFGSRSVSICNCETSWSGKPWMSSHSVCVKRCRGTAVPK